MYFIFELRNEFVANLLECCNSHGHPVCINTFFYTNLLLYSFIIIF